MTCDSGRYKKTFATCPKNSHRVEMFNHIIISEYVKVALKGYKTRRLDGKGDPLGIMQEIKI